LNGVQHSEPFGREQLWQAVRRGGDQRPHAILILDLVKKERRACRVCGLLNGCEALASPQSEEGRSPFERVQPIVTGDVVEGY
jgi:hypothetical protein